jgi:hypothetical protein
MALAKKPITLKNPVNPLAWNVPMVNPNGTPTEEFQRKWLQQAGANSTIVNVTTAAGVSAVLDILSSVVGSLLVRGTSAWQGLGPAGNGRVLRDHGAGLTPTWDTLSTILDLFSSTQGAVLYRDAAAWNALAPGGAGQVLTSGGPAANPAWSTSSSGGGAASIQDDGTTVFIALSDTDGQLVLDGSGDPIFSPEVFSLSALAPAVTAAQAYTDSKVGGAAWVPNDQSGAGITFSSVTCSYVHAGGVYFCTFDFTVSVNASGAVFDVGGLPATVGTRLILPAIVVGVAGIGVVSVSPGTATFGVNDSTNTGYTNAALSGKRVIGTAAFTL